MNQPIQEYLRNKHKQEQTLFSIKNGEGIYYPKKTPMPQKEFESYFPLGGKVTLFSFVPKGENPDKKRVI
jgi:hypothetical protein